MSCPCRCSGQLPRTGRPQNSGLKACAPAWARRNLEFHLEHDDSHGETVPALLRGGRVLGEVTDHPTWPDARGSSLARFNPDGSGETTLQTQLTLPGLVYAPGAVLRARVQVIGASPTTVRAKVWAAGTPEPAAWQRSVTDNSVGWQAPGALGLNPYLSGTATNAQVTMSFDDLRADSP
jgi:hypothetical protein